MAVTFITTGLIFYPTFKAFALDELEIGVKSTPILSKTAKKMKVGLFAATGLKVLVDPKASSLDKGLAALRVTCCASYGGASFASSLPLPPQVKVATSACCGVMWGLLSYAESKKINK